MDSPIRRYLFRYFLPMCLLYGALIGTSYISGVRSAWFSFARSHTEMTLSTVLPKAMFITDPARMGIKEEDQERFTVAFANKQAVDDARRSKSKTVQVEFKNFSLNITEFFLMPLFFLFSLIIITPISLKRKGIALLVGLLILYLFKCFHLYVVGLYQLDQSQLGIYTLGDTTQMIVSRLRLTLHTALAFVLPVFIWIGVCFRMDDWKNIKLQ